MTKALQCALLRLCHTIEGFEPAYERAIEHNDLEWLRANWRPMTLAIMQDIQHLADVAATASTKDMQRLELTMLATQRFMAVVAEMTGIPSE